MQVGKVAAKQLQSLKHHSLIFKNQMSRLNEISRRLLVMSTQSADVVPVCKAQKVVHT
jgi:hypothetical protein